MNVKFRFYNANSLFIAIFGPFHEERKKILHIAWTWVDLFLNK